MNEALRRVSELLGGVRRRTALLVILLGLEAVAIAIVFAVRADLLVQLLGLSVAMLALLFALRWPLVALFAFVALIPVETVVRVGDLGTVSRIAGIVFAMTYGIPRLGRLRLRAMPISAWLYVVWAVASLVWALDVDVVLVELPTLVQLFAISFLVADVVTRRPTIVRPLLWTYSLAAAFTALLGISAYIGGSVASGVRLSAFPEQDVAQFAAILLPALVFSMYQLLDEQWIPASTAVAVLTTTGIVLSGTRGAWVSAAVVGALFILPQLRPGRRVAAVLLMVGLVLVAYQLPGVSELVARRTTEAVPSGGAGRTDIWSVALGIVESAPVNGVGFANFQVAYTPERVRAAAIVNYTDPSFAPHSIIFGTVGELGLVGLLLLAMFLVPLLLRRGWGPDAAAVQAALASLMVAALFLDVLNRKQVWLIIGIAAGLSWLARRTTTAPTTPGPPRPIPSTRSVPLGVRSTRPGSAPVALASPTSERGIIR